MDLFISLNAQLHFTMRGFIPYEDFTALQHTRFILPPIHPTKFFACLAGRFFSFIGQELRTFQQTMTRRRPEA